MGAPGRRVAVDGDDGPLVDDCPLVDPAPVSATSDVGPADTGAAPMDVPRGVSAPLTTVLLDVVPAASSPELPSGTVSLVSGRWPISRVEGLARGNVEVRSPPAFTR